MSRFILQIPEDAIKDSRNCSNRLEFSSINLSLSTINKNDSGQGSTPTYLKEHVTKLECIYEYFLNEGTISIQFTLHQNHYNN